nr:DUF3265 domain-containing protein [Vibrio parahaemolyticus]
MTRRLSGIHAAWHFWYAVSFCGVTVVKLSWCGSVLHTLIGR